MNQFSLSSNHIQTISEWLDTNTKKKTNKQQQQKSISIELRHCFITRVYLTLSNMCNKRQLNYTVNMYKCFVDT